MLRSTRPVRWQKFHDIYFGVELERNEREQKPLEHPLHSNPHILIQRSREKPNKRFRKLCSTHLNFKGKKFSSYFPCKTLKMLIIISFWRGKAFWSGIVTPFGVLKILFKAQKECDDDDEIRKVNLANWEGSLNFSHWMH